MRMFLRGTPLLVVGAGCCLWASTASAQLPGGLNPGGRQAQAQVQQRTQATVQQRVQQQTQQRVQAQAQQQVQSQVNAQVAAAAQARLQSRIQADAARAVGIAQRAAQHAGREAASVRNRVPNGIRVDAEASASARGQARGQNNSARLGAKSQAGIHFGASLPPGITEADVQVYDNIFGRFNPLRTEASGEGSDQASTDPQQNPSAPLANQGGQTGPGDRTGPGDQTESGASGPGNNPDPDGPGNRFGVIAGGRPDFASRVVFAAQQRRAEISQLRDHALISGDAALMVRADEMEQRLNAFADASARARSATDAPGERSPARTARLPQTQLEGASATAIGAETK